MMKNHAALKMYEILVNFNKDKEFKDQIKFILGGSSAVFAFIGQSSTVQDKGHHFFKKNIPFSLIPTGQLRKKYNVYPISGELEIGTFNYGSRKAGINYHYLSGMDVSYEGICATLNYATYSKRVLNIDTIHQNIMSQIRYMSESDFQRSLKILLMEMTNLMLMDVNGGETGKKYIPLLMEKRQALLEQFPGNQNINRHFDKYLPRLLDILSGTSVPLEANDEFRQSILGQYPVIYCSTVKPIDILYDGLPDEKIFRGEIGFSTIKMLFTPVEFVDALKETLKKLSLSSIIVVGYSLTKASYQEALYNESTDAPSFGRQG